MAVVGWCYTFGFISLSRIFFQTPELEVASMYIQRMLSPSVEGLGAEYIQIVVIVITLVINFYGPFLFQGLLDIQKRIKKQLCGKNDLQNPSLMTFIYVLLNLLALIFSLYILLSLRPGGVAPYLYFQF